MGDFGEGVTVDDDGNAYISGHFRNDMTIFDETFDPESGQNTMFLVKLSPDEEVIWAVTAEADGVTGASGFKTAWKNDYVYLFGDFRGEATFSSADFTETVMNSDTRAAFVAKYSDNGVLQWVKKMESSHAAGIIPTGSANNLVVDDAGAVYVTTQFRTDIDIDGTVVDPEGSGGTNFHALVVKFDALGAYQWHWISTHEGDDRGEAITVTDDGNILFAVRYNEELTVNDVHYENDGGGIALIEVEPDGTYAWDHHVYTDDTNQANFWDMQFDDEGNLYIAGANRTTLTWDDDTTFEPSNPMRTDAFVIKLDEDRNLVWSKFFGDEDENALAKSVSFVGDILYVGGEFIGTMELNDDITLSSNDESRDIFYALMDPEDGSFVDAGAFGGEGNEILGTMGVNQDGDAYFMGRFLGTFEAGGESFPTEGSWDFFVTRYITEVEEDIPDDVVNTFPWTENFEDDWVTDPDDPDAPEAPEGWTVVTSASYWQHTDVHSFVGDYSARSYQGSGTGFTADEWLITPAINMDNPEANELIFMGKSHRAPDGVREHLRVLIMDELYHNVDDLHDHAVLIEDIYLDDEWVEYILNLEDYEGTNHLAFHYYIQPEDNPSFNWVYVDNVRVGDFDVWTLTMMDPMGQGSVVPEPGDHLYSDESLVYITAEADSAWYFDRWELNGDFYSGLADTSLVITADKQLQAFFELKDVYTLTMEEPDGMGTVIPEPGDHEYLDGDVAELSAAPGMGYYFSHWTGNVDDPDAPETTIVMDEDQTVRAVFEPIEGMELPFTEKFAGVDEGDIPEGWERDINNWAVHDSNNAGGDAPEMRFSWTPSVQGVFLSDNTENRYRRLYGSVVKLQAYGG